MTNTPIGTTRWYDFFRVLEPLLPRFFTMFPFFIEAKLLQLHTTNCGGL